MSSIPEDQLAYLQALTNALKEMLGDDLVGVYVHGSIALGGFHPTTSDVDVLAVCNEPVGAGAKARIASRLLELAPPAKGLEFSLVTAFGARVPERDVPFELHVARGATVEVVDGAERPGDEDLVLAIEICRRGGIALYGPASEQVFTAVPEEWLIAMCDRELAWIQDHPSRTSVESAVLQACRAWRYAEERVLSSKVDSGQWAQTRATSERDLIQAALARKLGDDSTEVDPDRALVFVGEIRKLTRR